MHDAPSVNYPVGRSRFQGFLLLCLWLLGLATVLAWCWQSDAVGWRQWFAMACLMGAGVLAIYDWRHTPLGSLCWDGQQWLWAALSAPGDPPCAVGVFCRLDLQQHMLLQLRPQAQRSLWCWVARAQYPERWHGLRRAVYSPARPRTDKSAVFGSEP